MVYIIHVIIAAMFYYYSAITQVGKPTDDWKNDPEGGPESAVSRAVRGATKFASQVSTQCTAWTVYL